MNQVYDPSIQDAARYEKQSKTESQQLKEDFESQWQTDSVEIAENLVRAAHARIPDKEHQQREAEKLIHESYAYLDNLKRQLSILPNNSVEDKERRYRIEHNIHLIEKFQIPTRQKAYDIRHHIVCQAYFIKEKTQEHLSELRERKVIENRRSEQRKAEEAAKQSSELAWTSQQKLNKNEIAACDTLVCGLGVKAEQIISQFTQDAAYKAGQLVGVGASVLDTGLGVVNLVTHPIDTTVKAYQFAVSDNKLEQIDNSFRAKLEHNQLEQNKGTVAGAFNAGLGGGKLTAEVTTAALVVPGAVKSAITGVQKVAALVGPAHAIPIAGTSITIPGRVLGEYSAVNPGPLVAKQVETFAGGRYSEIVLKENVKLYRAGTSEVQFGQYFSLDKPRGMVQVRIDKALLPEWPTGAKSPIDTVYTMEVPAGSKVYLGEVGTQSGFYVGGTHQVIIPSSWDLPGIKILSSEPLK